MATDGSYSSVDENHTPAAAREVQQFAQGLLKGLRFRGTFVEKRYVPAINTYRSIIHISPEEKPLIRILVEVTSRINKMLGENNPFFWIGFTRSKDQCLLWVNLTEEILGEYLFNIRAFDIDDVEAKVRLRQVRPKKETTPQLETTFNDIGSNFMDETVKPIVKNFTNDLGINLRSTITFTNLKDVSSFIIIAAIALISGAFYTAKYLLEFSLRLIREFSIVLKMLTPTMLSVIDLVKFVIFGLYWVILAFFKPSAKLPNNNNQQERLQYYNNYAYNNGQYQPQRAIQYRNPKGRYHKGGVEITELHD